MSIIVLSGALIIGRVGRAPLCPVDKSLSEALDELAELSEGTPAGVSSS